MRALRKSPARPPDGLKPRLLRAARIQSEKKDYIMPFGKLLIIFGLVLVAAGLAMLFSDKLPFLGRLGRLPGDIVIERERFRFYLPIVTSIILSIVLTILLNIFRK